VVSEIHALHRSYPHIVGTPITIGASWEGRPIWAVKISDQPDRDEPGEPAVLYDALHHAREPMGMEALLYAMREITRRYDFDPGIRALVDERELWFVPVVNPDGYVFGGIGGMWRKNRRPNPDGSFGVDLNRNYDYRWGADTIGSSPVPASPTYRGPAPFSEPETRAMRDFQLGRRFVAGMTFHAFADVNLLPYAASSAPETDELRTYDELAHDLETLTGYPHGQPWEILYPSNGRSQDWQAHVAGMVVIEPEIGSAVDGFWPPPARIEPLAARIYPAILHIARIAGPHLVVNELAVAGEPAGDGNGYADPGETCELRVTIENRGLCPSAPTRLRFTSSSAALTFAGGRNTLATMLGGTGEVVLLAPSIAPGGKLTLVEGTIPVRLAPETKPGARLAMAVELEGLGLAQTATLAELAAGTPRRILAHEEAAATGRWDLRGGWGLDGIPGAAIRFTDSPDGSYPPAADRALTLLHPVSLAGIEHAELRYQERLAVEPWEDRCHVEARVPGGDWEPLLMIPGGVKARFRERRLSLDRYAGEDAVWLRFRLVTNETIERDGWTLAGIEVWGFPGTTPEAHARAAGKRLPLSPSHTGSATSSSAAE
jgi:hypothetical protein